MYLNMLLSIVKLLFFILKVAVKTIKKAKIENEEDMLRIRREIHIMTSLRHPHIIHIHEGKYKSLFYCFYLVSTVNNDSFVSVMGFAYKIYNWGYYKNYK